MERVTELVQLWCGSQMDVSCSGRGELNFVYLSI